MSGLCWLSVCIGIPCLRLVHIYMGLALSRMKFKNYGMSAAFSGHQLMGLQQACRVPWGCSLNLAARLDIHADICYDAEFAAMALTWLQEQVRLGTQVLIGDPGRAYLPRTGHALTLLHTYRLPDAVEEENHGLVSGGVYAVNDS